MKPGVGPSLVMLASMVVAACSPPATPVASGIPSGSPLRTLPATTPSASVAPTAAPVENVSGTFDIGDGRQLYLQCVGSGSPTVLFEAGDQDSGGGAWAESCRR